MWLPGLTSLAAFLIGTSVYAAPTDVRRAPVKRQQLLQDLVNFDEHSLFVRGERIFLYSGEFHPFRLPVPGLWLDVFQKIKAMGFSGVSFYVDWGLVEGNPGHVNLEGVFDFGPFFDAAAEAGIYLLARPGPYINAETAAGGFPGWTLRINCTLRSTCPEYENATVNYLSTIGKVIADAQITNGGPVILVQPENEYSTYPGVNATDFPDQMNREYMAFVEQQLRDAGIVVPFIDNDNEVLGSFAPGTGLGAVDLYGIDAYPLRYDCADPSVWPTYEFPRTYATTHELESPTTPFAIPEFQGGSGTSWGGVSQDMCNALVNEEAVRVVYKNNYAAGVKLFNIYMTYGGTNWGNLGYMGGDSSYDYGAAITEDRHVWREKYSEEKLEANFFKVSPAYLTATPGNASNGSYVSTAAVATTPLFGENGTNFYVVRQADFTSTANVSYSLSVSTSVGNVTIPQLGGQLSLFGRDSKLQVTDYDVGGINLVYSTADIFTWAKSASGKTVLILYGTAGELHEFAVPASSGEPSASVGSSAKIEQKGSTWIVQWQVTPSRQIISFGSSSGLQVRLLWRNDAYNHWVLELPAAEPMGNYSSPTKSSVIVKAGYLMRTAAISGTVLSLTGDINATTGVELLLDSTDTVESLVFNEAPLSCQRSSSGTLGATIDFKPPSLVLSDFASAQWKSIDTLPEVRSDYDDSLWTICDHGTTTNDQLDLETPTSLFASDYGYHTGSLLYRGHFVANGQELALSVNVSGGYAFGHSIFLNSTFLGSWTGNNSNQTYAQTLPVPSDLTAGQPYVLTVLIDHMGQTEEGPGTDAIKFPIGILNYSLAGHAASDVTWKMTGNLGGEDYRDLARGPRNEGAMYAERQGYHQPAPPSANWTVSSPMNDGLTTAGVNFYSTGFDLHVPTGYDVPMSFVFTNNTNTTTRGINYRVQLFVNGYQFGKLISNLGPQTAYPVPEGILNYNGTNYVALTLWALDAEGAQLGGLSLEPQMPVYSGYVKPGLSPQPAWQAREGAY